MKNTEQLVRMARMEKKPIAMLKCEWSSNRNQGEGIKSVFRSHFKGDSIVFRTDICVKAKVAISGINIVLEAGLYNGARGTVVDIVYDTVEGPTNKQEGHLPRYVVVDFPKLKLGNAKPWDSYNPTVSIGTSVLHSENSTNSNLHDQPLSMYQLLCIGITAPEDVALQITVLWF